MTRDDPELCFVTGMVTELSYGNGACLVATDWSCFLAAYASAQSVLKMSSTSEHESLLA